ncbi:ABC transporter ATP-binding protein [Methylobacterium oryzisoli]|uniref:ABC transporter ATP-binding protein n=1 Tax=Methylobacterium oryzisoli TaxID=3385502 RepID=UPI003891EF85
MTSAALRVVGDGAPASASASSRPLIEIRGLAKTYRTRDGDVPSLRPIDLDLAAGEFVAVVGPSGCGKSTLLKLVGGLIPPSAGEVRIAGRPVTEPPDDVGIVFQNPVLLAWRTVLRNVMMPVEVRGLDRGTHLARARALLKTAGLSDFEQKYPWQLSGGMQQRTSICRALVHDPKIVLMDEPFGALDAMTRERMNLELQRIHGETGKTVLLITHSIPEAIFLADRVVVMSERPGTVAAIYDIDLPRPRTIEMLGNPVFADLARRVRSHFYAQGGLD